MDKKNIDLMKQVVAEPMSPSNRRLLQDLKMDVARLIASRNPTPDLALTCLLNLMGSIIGTQFDTAEDRVSWMTQIQAQLPLYVEAYRSREKRIL